MEEGCLKKKKRNEAKDEEQDTRATSLAFSSFEVTCGNKLSSSYQ